MPNIYKGEGKQGKKWLSTIEALKEDVSPKRLYHLAKESCRGMMHNWFNAFEGDEFTNLEELLIFFKQQFHKDEEDKDLSAWQLVIEGPGQRNILDFSYELKSACKDTTLTLSTVKNQYKKWVSRFILDKISLCETWMDIFECFKNKDIVNSDKKIFKNQFYKKNRYNDNISNKFNDKYIRKTDKYCDDKKDNAMILECSEISDGNNYEVKVKGKHSYNALIDTGANASFISIDVMNKENLKLKGKSTKIKQAVGCFVTEGNTLWKVKNGSNISNLEFKVVKNLGREIIFGTDAIDKLKLKEKRFLYTVKDNTNDEKTMIEKPKILKN
ncbi:hypothetical protein DMUE_4674 [Dictyocoela muelleri]|nr:hypothetical protein DMUE_4674 [Dictyocoela muelleri]